MSHGFRQMEIWQTAFGIALEINKLCERFPVEEKYVLSNQIKRAALSTFSNIAEGYGRGGTLDKRKFYIISRGSMMELESQIEFAFALNYLDQDKRTELVAKIEKWYFSMNRLIKSYSR